MWMLHVCCLIQFLILGDILGTGRTKTCILLLTKEDFVHVTCAGQVHSVLSNTILIMKNVVKTCDNETTHGPRMFVTLHG